MFCLSAVAELVELFVVASLSKSRVVSVRVRVLWEERGKVGVGLVKGDFVE